MMKRSLRGILAEFRASLNWAKASLILVATLVPLIDLISRGNDLFMAWKPWVYAYVVVDLIGFELVVISLAILSRKSILAILESCWQFILGGPEGVGGRLGIAIYVGSLSLVGILIAFTISQAHLYAGGKRAKMRYYSADLIDRARGAEEAGRRSEARMHLEVGRVVLNSNQCERHLRDIEQLEKSAETIQNVLPAVPLDHDIHILLLHDLYRLDTSGHSYRAAHLEFVTRWRKDHQQISEALQAIRNGDTGGANKLLAESEGLQATRLELIHLLNQTRTDARREESLQRIGNEQTLERIFENCVPNHSKYLADEASFEEVASELNVSLAELQKWNPDKQGRFRAGDLAILPPKG